MVYFESLFHNEQGRRNGKRAGWAKFKKGTFKTTKGQLFCFLGGADGLRPSAPLSTVTELYNYSFYL